MTDQTGGTDQLITAAAAALHHLLDGYAHALQALHGQGDRVQGGQYSVLR